MKNESVRVKKVEHLTHDVLHIVVDKPDGANFHPGQATEVFIDKEGWRNQGRPFTFICLPEEENLEFAIKTYPDHGGVTNELLNLEAGDQLILNDIFGAIEYKGEGTFIAGGAGITPFIAILRQLKANNELHNNTLIFSNKTERDIILKEEFEEMLGDKFINILSEEESDIHAYGMVSEEFIEKYANLDGYFYICGPIPMINAVKKQLANLGIPDNRIIIEDF